MSNILIIDDNETIRDALTAIISKMGHEAIACSSGRPRSAIRLRSVRIEHFK